MNLPIQHQYLSRFKLEIQTLKRRPQSDLIILVSFNPSKESIEKSQNVPIIPVGARAW